MKPLSAEQKIQISYDCIAIGALLGFGFWVNRGIAIKGLSTEDLYLWLCFKEQSFIEYVFGTGKSGYRCLYYLFSWLEMALVGTHVEWLVPVNIILNSMLAAFLYKIGERLSSRKVFGFLGGILFLMSRMAFYQIGQMGGLMETMACFLAVGLLYCVYIYLHEKQEKVWYFHGACILYLLLCFVHERFMVLLPLFYLVLVLKRRFQLRKWFWPLRQFLIASAIRFLAIGKEAFSDLVQILRGEGVSLKEVLHHGADQAAYLLGINAGPKYLNGLSWGETPRIVRWLVYGADMLFVLLLLVFLIKLFKKKEEREKLLAESILFLAFIGLCILSASFTKQVEVPQVYISYGAFLLWINFMIGTVVWPVENLGESQHQEAERIGSWGQAASGGDSAEANYLSQHTHQQLHKKDYHNWILAACTGGFILYLVLMLPTERFFRAHYQNIYLWPEQIKYNSLAGETYGKYGEDVFGKTIYVIGSKGEINDQAARHFFQVFDKARQAQGTNLKFIDSILDIGLITKQMLVLRVDKDNGGFQDITQFVRELKYKPEYGIYEDGWMDEECGFTIQSGNTGVIRFQFLYPGHFSGGEETEIYVDGELWQKISVTENIYYGELQAKPYQTLKVQIKSNFFVENAREQRGEKKLTALVEMETE